VTTPLRECLRAHEASILRRWGELIFSSYPRDGAAFFLGEKDPFRNPVGTTVRRATEILFAALAEGAGGEEVRDALDRVVRIRSVQDLSPAQAVGFVLLLKQAVSEALASAPEPPDPAEVLEFHGRVDALLLDAVDAFARCREAVYQIRAKETIARTYSLLRSAGAIEEPDPARIGPRPGGSGRTFHLKGGPDG
jgi:hypothetical protein